MKRHMDDQPSNLAGRLKDLEHFTGALVGGREQVPDHEPKTMPISKTCIPVPRRSRVFLRTGDGHGAFADLTLTAPHPRVALD